jgi:hypothetical protein
MGSFLISTPVVSAIGARASVFACPLLGPELRFSVIFASGSGDGG